MTPMTPMTPMTSMTPLTPLTPVRALDAAVRAEFAAVYLYGLIGGRASRSGKAAELVRIDASYAAHRLRRDQLLAFLTARGVPAPVPAVAYTAPMNPISVATRTGCSRLIEEHCASIYAQLVAAVEGPERAFAMNALAATAVAAVALGQRPSPFPGLVL